MPLRMTHYFKFQARNVSHIWEQDEKKTCVVLPMLIIVIIPMLIENKQQTNKQENKLAEKNDASCCWKAISQGYHQGPDVSVLVTSINMQQNLAKLKDLKIQLNVTNSTLCMWSFCPSKRENHHFDLGEHPIYTIHEKPRVAANWKISGLLWTAAG